MDITITFNHALNDSLQEGDSVYYCPNQSLGGFDTVDNTNLPSTGIVRIGNCTLINQDTNTITILVDTTIPLSAQQSIANGIGIGDFVMFSKNTQVNLSSLLGYYAEVTFSNNSPDKSELFAVSTEFSESSK